MKRIRIIGLAILALFAFSAIAASAAQAATEGPFWRVAGTRLASGKTEEITAKAVLTTHTEGFVLGFGAVKLACKALKLGKGAKIIGSTGANAGTNEEILEFSECTVTGNGTPCAVKEPIITKTVKSTLGYANENRTGQIYVLFAPLTGTEFVTFGFDGTGCELTSTKVTGSTVGLLLTTDTTTGVPVEVGKEIETTLLAITFLGNKSTTIYTEAEGKLTKTEASLKLSGIVATFLGEASVSLVSGKSAGAYTK